MNQQVQQKALDRPDDLVDIRDVCVDRECSVTLEALCHKDFRPFSEK